jgi:TfoX/Sxy family transcriptional regulator of competence genes
MKTKNRESVEVDPAFAPVVAAFAKDRTVTAGKMMSSYGLKVNGKIFAMFGRGRFVTKLPKQRVDELVSGGVGERFDPGHGRLMKEWISIESRTETWVEFAREAYKFVKAGKP